MKKNTEQQVSKEEEEAYTTDNIVDFSTAMEGVHDKIKDKLSKTIPADVGTPKDKLTESAAQIYEDAGMPEVVTTSIGEHNVHVSEAQKPNEKNFLELNLMEKFKPSGHMLIETTSLE
jgi:hypothetical protein